MGDHVELTIVGWSGCPTTGTVRSWIEATCLAAGIDVPSSRLTYIETDEDARTAGFVGSPTFLHDGRDMFPQPDAPPALTCRVYLRRDGRPSPLPDPADFVDALRGLNPIADHSERS